MRTRTESADGWCCVYCGWQNDFEAELDEDAIIPEPDGDNELPIRCRECGKVCTVTAEVVDVLYVAEPCEDQSSAVNDGDDDFDEDEDGEDDDFDEEGDDFDEVEEDFDEGEAIVPPPTLTARIAATPTDNRQLVELHADHPTVGGAVPTGWERSEAGRVHPACKGLHTVSDGCRGTVEPCERCGRPRCYTEGTSSLGELCDTCWFAVARGAYWPTMEAVDLVDEANGSPEGDWL